MTDALEVTSSLFLEVSKPWLAGGPETGRA